MPEPVFAFRFSDTLERLGGLPTDSVEQRVRKNILTLSTILIGLAGLLWGGIYLALGLSRAAAIPTTYTALSACSLALFAKTRNYERFRFIQLTLILFLPFVMQLQLGGFTSASAVILWSILAPVGALMFGEAVATLAWFGAFFSLVVIAGVLENQISLRAPAALEPWRGVFYIMNVTAPSAIVYVLLRYFVQNDLHLRQVIREKDREIEEGRKKQLGPYTLEEPIGEGGMGTVFRAQHALLRRPTAVKLLKPDSETRVQFKRFEREVQTTSELNHPNIVNVYDYGQSPEGELYYAMEYLPGIDLETLIQREGRQPLWRALHALIQACDALDEAHHAGLIHRDIKPGNLMLCRLGRRPDTLKVLDFGLVKQTSSDVRATADYSVAGTPNYLAPEAMTDPDSVGPASDLYALGAVAYYVITGAPVFSGKTVAEICGHTLHTAPLPPSSRCPELGNDVDDVLLKCLAKAPEDRFGSALELRDALARLAKDHPWQPDLANEWWDHFESRPAHVSAPPVTGHEVTIDLKSR